MFRVGLLTLFLVMELFVLEREKKLLEFVKVKIKQMAI